MPTSHDEHLHEKRLMKTPSSSTNNCLKIITSHPSDLKVVPNVTAKITLEEEMSSIFMNMQRT
jgi:hypothetical protein